MTTLAINEAYADEAWDVGPVFIGGIAKPQGSKRFLGVTKARPGAKGKLRFEESANVKDWRADVRGALTDVLPAPLDGPIEARALFTFRRPAAHHVAGDHARPLKPNAPTWCTSHAAGDLDKLVRAIGDALTGIVWQDDALIVRWTVEKRWGDIPGLTLAVRRIR